MDVCLHPIVLHSDRMAVDRNSLAASEWNTIGHPFRSTISYSMVWAVLAAVRPCTALSTSVPVAKSIMPSMLLYPAEFSLTEK